MSVFFWSDEMKKHDGENIPGILSKHDGEFLPVAADTIVTYIMLDYAFVLNQIMVCL